MKQHRESLKKAAEDNWKKKEASQAPPRDAFKMRQFKNVQSKLKVDLQMQSAREDVRAQTAEGQHSASFSRIQSARQRRASNAGAPPSDNGIAFGRTQ